MKEKKCKHEWRLISERVDILKAPYTYFLFYCIHCLEQRKEEKK